MDAFVQDRQTSPANIRRNAVCVVCVNNLPARIDSPDALGVQLLCQLYYMSIIS